MGSFTLSSPSQTLTFAFMAAYTTCIYCSLSMIRDPNHCSEFNLYYMVSIQDIVKSLALDNYIFSVLSAKKSWFHCFPYVIYTKLKTVIKPYFTRKTRIFYFATLYLWAIFRFLSRSFKVAQSQQYNRLFPVFSIIPPHRLQREYFLWSLIP